MRGWKFFEFPGVSNEYFRKGLRTGWYSMAARY